MDSEAHSLTREENKRVRERRERCHLGKEAAELPEREKKGSSHTAFQKNNGIAEILADSTRSTPAFCNTLFSQTKSFGPPKRNFLSRFPAPFSSPPDRKRNPEVK